MPKPIEIFKTGRHTAESGLTLEYTEADLRAAVEAYDPALSQAPLVVGHPKTDAPAYGWVKSLRLDGGVLFAEPDQVDVQFAEIVNAGRYKRISSTFYLPTAPGNPKPGSLYLKHVGFLGAQAPAVKGLKAVSFSEQEEGVVTFADGDDSGLWRRLRDWFISKFGLDEADQVLPDWAVGSIEAAAIQSLPDTPTPAYAEPKEEPSVTIPTQQELDAKAAELERREKALKDQETAARHGQNVSFAEGLVTKGKLLPVHKDGLVAFMDGIAPEGVVSFGEGTARTSQPTLDWFKRFLDELPKAVEFGEVGGGELPSAETVSFAAPANAVVDKEALVLHQKALAYQSKHGGEYLDAVHAVGGQ